MSESTIRTLSEDELNVVAGGVTFNQALSDLLGGGVLVLAGASSLVSGAASGIIQTPMLILDSLGDITGSLGLGGLDGIVDGLSPL
ncbi:hypothetical protein [Halomonas binhaiensis]|uniref:Bacteriocin n=1 Tax=Halomonas binhaiensis TaxID=2562282 RepID=A0A5C1NE01_9GAMM|nr:hypothetical protein [Halomonas binhaiensis]QEM80688.1 hypothetical protein E4T21_03270 [Halomonas binhaiensis]